MKTMSASAAPNVIYDANNPLICLPFDIAEKIVLNYLSAFDLFNLCQLNSSTAVVIHHIYRRFEIDKVCAEYAEPLRLRRGSEDDLYDMLSNLVNIMCPEKEGIETKDWQKANAVLKDMLLKIGMTFDEFVKALMYKIMCLSVHTAGIKVAIRYLYQEHLVYDLTKLPEYEVFTEFLERCISEYTEICIVNKSTELLFDLWTFAYKNYFLINSLNVYIYYGISESMEISIIKKYAARIGTKSAQIVAHVVINIICEGLEIITSMGNIQDFDSNISELTAFGITQRYIKNILWTIHPSIIKLYISTYEFLLSKPVYSKKYIDTLTKYATLTPKEIHALYLAGE